MVEADVEANVGEMARQDRVFVHGLEQQTRRCTWAGEAGLDMQDWARALAGIDRMQNAAPGSW